MNQDIEKAIRESLPEHISKDLQKRLALADKCEALQEEKRRLLATSHKYMEEIGQLKENATRLSVIEKRESEVLIRERIVTLIEQHSASKVEMMRGLVQSVFENRQITRVAFSSGDMPVSDGHGGCILSHTSSMTTTDEDEK